jgi:hypothetical protein
VTSTATMTVNVGIRQASALPSHSQTDGRRRSSARKPHAPSARSEIGRRAVEGQAAS